MLREHNRLSGATWVIDAHGGVVVTSPDDAGSFVFTRVYDVRDWPFKVEGAVGPRLLGPPPDQVVTAGDDWTMRVILLDKLQSVIIETVAPDTWREAGGAIGSMYALAGWLVITQTAENHERVRELLNALRADPAPASRPTTRPTPGP